MVGQDHSSSSLTTEEELEAERQKSRMLEEAVAVLSAKVEQTNPRLATMVADWLDDQEKEEEEEEEERRLSGELSDAVAEASSELNATAAQLDLAWRSCEHRLEEALLWARRGQNARRESAFAGLVALTFRIKWVVNRMTNKMRETSTEDPLREAAEKVAAAADEAAAEMVVLEFASPAITECFHTEVRTRGKGKGRKNVLLVVHTVQSW